MTVPRFGTLMGHIKEALRETFFPTLFMGEGVNADSRGILGHSVKRDGLGIPDPRLSVNSACYTFNKACGELVGSLFLCTNHNYIGHRECISGASTGERK